MNNINNPTKPRSDCHVRVYGADSLVMAFDVNDSPNAVAKRLFDILTDDVVDDNVSDCFDRGF